MAANDELPRGWIIEETFGSGQTPSLSKAAAAGIASVLTSVKIRLLYYAVQSTNGNIGFSANSTAGGGSFSVGWVGWTPNTPAMDVVAVDWSGSWTAIEGSGVQVFGNNPVPSSCYLLLQLQGYDI